MRQLSNFAIHCLFGFIAGCVYLLIELMWRGCTNWTMLPLAAIIFICVGLLDELKNPPPFWAQVVIGTFIATFLELIAGLILNVWLKLNIWDYSYLPGNFMGQICPQYTLAWCALVIIAIKIENLMHKIVEYICTHIKK